MRNLTNKLNFLILTIVFAALLAGCSSRLTAEAPATVTRVAIDRDTKTQKRKTSSNRKKKTTTSIETEIDYRYTVNGKSYDGFSEKDGDVQRDFQTGASVKVCYSPEQPDESEVFPANHKCGN